MIVIRVELHSAITGRVTELARMIISHASGGANRADYDCATLRGRCKADLDKRKVQRQGDVKDYPRQAIHVWNLVAEALTAMKYGRNVANQPAEDEPSEVAVAPQ